MDKSYPRFLIRKRRCKCGTSVCPQRVWLAFLLQTEADKVSPDSKPIIENKNYDPVMSYVQGVMRGERYVTSGYPRHRFTE